MLTAEQAMERLAEIAPERYAPALPIVDDDLLDDAHASLNGAARSAPRTDADDTLDRLLARLVAADDDLERLLASL
jgi:hypothetical protein